MGVVISAFAELFSHFLLISTLILILIWTACSLGFLFYWKHLCRGACRTALWTSGKEECRRAECLGTPTSVSCSSSGRKYLMWLVNLCTAERTCTDMLQLLTNVAWSYAHFGGKKCGNRLGRCCVLQDIPSKRSERKCPPPPATQSQLYAAPLSVQINEHN